MGWMVSLGVTLLGMLADALPGLINRILISLGIGLVAAHGFNALIQGALSLASFSGASATFAQALDAVGVNWFISTMASAVTTRLTIKGLTSDTFQFWRMRQGIGGP